MSKNKYPLFLLVLLLIFTIAIDVSAQTTYSLNPSTYMPIIMKNFRNAFLVDTPSGTLAVFSSTATTNGSAGGRPGMNAICQNEDTDAFFCSLNVIENAFTTTGVFFVGPFSESWVDTFNPLRTVLTPGSMGTSMSDWSNSSCTGWTSDASQAGAYIIKNDGVTVHTVYCSESRPVTCCKWSP